MRQAPRVCPFVPSHIERKVREARSETCIDLIAHQLSHALTAKLSYEDESGALNESFCDVFGIMAKQRALQQTASEADWLIGAGIRSMKTAAHVRDFDRDADPLVNCNIPNHAFYLAATLLGGRSWDVAGPVWFAALRKLGARARFRDAAAATSNAAGELYGRGGGAHLAVIEAWSRIGVEAGPRLHVREYMPPSPAAEVPQLHPRVRKPPRASK